MEQPGWNVDEGDVCKFILLICIWFTFESTLSHFFKSAVTILPSSLSAELFYTERAHVRTLKVLHNVFYQRVTREGILNSSDKRKIFSNLEDILGLHGKSGRGASWLHSLSWNSGYKYLRKVDTYPETRGSLSQHFSLPHTIFPFLICRDILMKSTCAQ